MFLNKNIEPIRKKKIIKNLIFLFLYFLSFLITRLFTFALLIFLMVKINNYTDSMDYLNIFLIILFLIISTLVMNFAQKNYFLIIPKVKIILSFWGYKIQAAKFTSALVGFFIFEASSMVVGIFSNLYFFLLVNLAVIIALYLTFQKVSSKKLSLIVIQVIAGSLVVAIAMLLHLLKIQFSPLDYFQFSYSENLITFFNIIKNYSFMFMITTMLGLRWMCLHLYNYPTSFIIKKIQSDL